MQSALVIGGTRFIGRHTVTELLDHEYDVAIFNRGNHENPFEDDDRVTHVPGDRTDRAALERAADAVDPAIVIDCVAYFPEDVAVATEVFADVEGYVYVSSGDAYGREEIPKREDETPLQPRLERAVDEVTDETYGPLKAAGDRAVVSAAEAGVNAISVRPCIVYGPHDYTERIDYWIDRVRRFDRVLVPGDGQNVWHRAYVADVARALRIVAERGAPGEVYNVGDRRLRTLEETLETIAAALDTSVEVVHASARELATEGLDPSDFVLYREYPHVLSTAKLAGLGWSSTPLEEAMASTVADHVESERDGSEWDPGRDAEERLLDALETP